MSAGGESDDAASPPDVESQVFDCVRPPRKRRRRRKLGAYASSVGAEQPGAEQPDEPSLNTSPAPPVNERRTRNRPNRRAIEMMDSFGDEIKGWNDLIPILTMMKNKLGPRRRWPLGEAKEKRMFQALDVFLDLNSSGHSSDLLVRYLQSGRAGSGGSASLVTRRETAEAVSKAGNGGQLLDNVKMLLDGCRDEYDNGKQCDPIVNSIRMSLLQILQGVRSRNELTREGFNFSNGTWQMAAQHVAEYGMSTLYQQAAILGRLPTSAAMMEEIRKFIMTDAHTYVLPQRESTRCEGARALLKTPTELHYLFPLKNKISKDKFCKLLSGNLDSATPKLRKWLHVTDLCAMCPKRLIAIRYMRSLVANIANHALSTECSDLLERIYVISEAEADPQLGREDELNLGQVHHQHCGELDWHETKGDCRDAGDCICWLPPFLQEQGQRCLSEKMGVHMSGACHTLVGRLESKGVTWTRWP